MDSPSGSPKPYTYLKETKSDDPNAPTAIFLDISTVGIKIGPGTYLDHGEISRLGAEKAGYNTIDLNLNQQLSGSNNFYDYSPALKQIDADIRSGRLKAGVGDVLNVSLVMAKTTFEEVSSLVGKPITPANLAQNKDLILHKVNNVARDETRSTKDRQIAQSILDTNRAITRLQEDGLTVIHSAGNDGQNAFQVAFMNANVQLSSNKPDGTPDTFSESNSLTVKGNGVFPVVYHPGGDVLDPTPLARQKGSFEIVGANIVVPNQSHEAFLANTKVFDRQNFDADRGLPNVSPSPVVLSAKDFLPSVSLSEETPLASWGTLAPISSESTAYDADSETQAVLRTHAREFPAPVPLGPNQLLVVGTIQGTSFSNIGYLQSHYAQFRQAKAEALYGKLLRPSLFSLDAKGGD